jgi:hypothetical protein
MGGAEVECVIVRSLVGVLHVRLAKGKKQKAVSGAPAHRKSSTLGAAEGGEEAMRLAGLVGLAHIDRFLDRPLMATGIASEANENDIWAARDNCDSV